MSKKLLLNLTHRTTSVILNHVQRRNMPVNVPATATGKRRFRLEVETDPHKLVNYCCGLNYHKDEPPIKLKPDSEYPDWLWTLRLEPKPKSWEMEKGTKEYYLRLAEEEKDQNYIKKMTTQRRKKVVGKNLLSHQEYLHYKRFAALAHLEDDIGLEKDSMKPDWFLDTSEKVKQREYYLPMDDRVIYMDKIDGNIERKNFYQDEDSTFKFSVRIERLRPVNTKPIQDSKRRHFYASN